MAFSTFNVGDAYNLGWNMKAKKVKSGYTPVPGHLVLLDASIANAVDIIAANENPYGIIDSIGNWTATNTGALITVAEFVPGTEIVLPTTGTIAKGDKIEYGGTPLSGGAVPRTVVQADNSNGVGVVIAAGAGESPAGADTAVVRF